MGQEGPPQQKLKNNGLPIVENHRKAVITKVFDVIHIPPRSCVLTQSKKNQKNYSSLITFESCDWSLYLLRLSTVCQLTHELICFALCVCCCSNDPPTPSQSTFLKDKDEDMEEHVETFATVQVIVQVNRHIMILAFYLLIVCSL